MYVANCASNTVSLIDTSTNSVIATVNVENVPFGISASPKGTKVFLVNGVSGTVSVIDTTTNAVTATIPVGYSAREFGRFIGSNALTPE